jgi:hypothetical protein
LVADVAGIAAGPRSARCIDGDPTCDADGLANGQCRFEVRLCVNQPGSARCGPDTVTGAAVVSPDPAFTPLADAVAQLPIPPDSPGPCTEMVAVDVTRGSRKSAKEILRSRASMASGHADNDKLPLVCRRAPGGSDFARIEKRIFKVSCTTASCHGAAGAGGLMLTRDVDLANLVGVQASNPVAAAAGLLRVAPGDPDRSFLVRKLEGTLEAGEGDAMPQSGARLRSDLIELIRRWIAAGAPS